ncbi:Protein of unknown function [Pyronema omphalodes CBS 100304]|uniref:Uncharacterized protein n=1 Tax=Pyronema omphalodes (strain CBS 100304) TaxID=1076935 RepID=U4KXP1_PYROM|nr:Protein of unknown function [Pyronema omphalodes CBS 100304]
MKAPGKIYYLLINMTNADVMPLSFHIFATDLSSQSRNDTRCTKLFNSKIRIPVRRGAFLLAA